MRYVRKRRQGKGEMGAQGQGPGGNTSVAEFPSPIVATSAGSVGGAFVMLSTDKRVQRALWMDVDRGK
jgi:hypothetical protein